MTKASKHYLLTTFALTYLMWIPLIVLTQNNILKYGNPIFMVLYLIGGNAPPICAIIIKKNNSDPKEFKAFLKNIVNPKYSIIWYLMSIVLALVTMGLSMAIAGGTVTNPLYMLVVLMPVMIIGGGFEEIGWRGMLLPNLLEKFPPFFASLILGAIWTAWHIPLFYIVGTFQQMNMTLLDFFISIMATTFLLTIIYRGTKSIFMCIIFHAFSNALMGIFAPNSSLLANFVVLLFSVCVFFVYEFLSKKAENVSGKI